MRRGVIIDFDNKFVEIEYTAPEMLAGKKTKLSKERVSPTEWIGVGEEIWHVEHNYWNFERMFEKKS